MFNAIRQWFKPSRCAVCGRKPVQPQRYVNDRGEPVLVCRKCTEYAERRAFVRRK
jgi:predicted SprT family Zn-dependent metalloprotease